MLHGNNLIGNDILPASDERFRATDPKTALEMEPPFSEASATDVDRALQRASEAFTAWRDREPGERAKFLDAIAAEIDTLGEALIARAASETALPADRLRGERARTTGQLRMFARLIEEGSWVDARIDHALPDRKPIPKPDLRRMLIPIGPVVVFGASNFPLAFSTAGGDTASALAAGCPVIVKAHPAHPGTSELVAGAIQRAAQTTAMPAGVFSLLHGRKHEVGLALTRHPLTAAVAFTGSLRAGRALFDAAAARPNPIPVYAEMGSVNPVFFLPGALARDSSVIAERFVQSITLGVGQFCTNPGLAILLEGPIAQTFIEAVIKRIAAAATGTMLYDGVRSAFAEGVKKVGETPGVRVTACATSPSATQVAPALFVTDAATFLANPSLGEEVFGPSSLIITAKSPSQVLDIARRLQGQLTATVHATKEDTVAFRELISLLATKAGRVLFNGFPTGVEVCPAMQHGGPYPATTDARTTSVGTAAIERFVRPVCFQDFPATALRAELREENPRKLWRIIDGVRGQR